MTADLLICWYAMGVVACGMNFGFLPRDLKSSWVFCLLFPLLIFILVLVVAVCKFAVRLPLIDSSKQYLWRRRK